MTKQEQANGKRTLKPNTSVYTNFAQIPFSHEAAFVGRVRELAAIAQHFENPGCHLLSLVGLGGVGKTRIAEEAAKRLAGHFAHGACFIPLAPITSPDLIASAIAAAIGFTFQSSEPSQIQLINALRSREMLLILDNFEHLISGGAELVAEILQAAPGVRLLITSRGRLNLREEWVIDIHGLEFPVDKTDAENFSAVQLFVQNARRVKADFQLTDANRADVVRICHLVDGLPLGIELAAAWARALSCRAIGDEIERNLDLLTTSSRNVPEKHRSMRAVFSRSYDLLTAEQQQVFSKLSVFRGGFDHEAAEAVTGASLMMLADLVDKSLLSVSNDGRCDIHELLRQYGNEKLEASGVGDDVQDVHSAYYADFLNRRVEDLKGRRQIEAMVEINAEFENVRAAWNRAAAHQHEVTVEKMIEGLWVFCGIRYREHEGRALFRYSERQFAPKPGDEPQRLWGRLLVRAADRESIQTELEMALRIAQQYDDRSETAFCLHRLGWAAYDKGDFVTSKLLLEQSLAIYRQLGDRYAMAEVLFTLMTQNYKKNWDNFKRYGEESLRLRHDIGDQIGAAWSLSAVALAEGREGRFEEAERLWLERIAVGHQTGNLDLIALGNAHVSYLVYFVQGDFVKARAAATEVLKIAAATEALKIAAALHHSNAIGCALITLGLLANVEEHYQEGKSLCQQGASARSLAYVTDLAAWGLSIASCGLGDFDAAQKFLSTSLNYMTDSRGLTGVIACLPIAAILLAHNGHKVHAVELLGFAFTHPVRAWGWMEKWPLLTRFRAELEQTLGAQSYSEAWERGTRLDAETTAAELRARFTAPEETNSLLEDPLTERELEILRLVAAGLSNRDIAKQLVVAVSTIKWHLGEIFSKLHVSSRTQAVRRAQELNLLS